MERMRGPRPAAGRVSAAALPRGAPTACTGGARIEGRSSDSWARPALAGHLPAVASQTLYGPSAVLTDGRLSFPLTAAGQPRTRTGFPLASALASSGQNLQQAGTLHVVGADTPMGTCRVCRACRGPRVGRDIRALMVPVSSRPPTAARSRPRRSPLSVVHHRGVVQPSACPGRRTNVAMEGHTFDGVIDQSAPTTEGCLVTGGHASTNSPTRGQQRPAHPPQRTATVTCYVEVEPLSEPGSAAGMSVSIRRLRSSSGRTPPRRLADPVPPRPGRHDAPEWRSVGRQGPAPAAWLASYEDNRRNAGRNRSTVAYLAVSARSMVLVGGWSCCLRPQRPGRRVSACEDREVIW